MRLWTTQGPANLCTEPVKYSHQEVLEKLLSDQGTMPECLEPFLDHLERN